MGFGPIRNSSRCHVDLLAPMHQVKAWLSRICQTDCGISLLLPSAPVFFSHAWGLNRGPQATLRSRLSLVRDIVQVSKCWQCIRAPRKLYHISIQGTQSVVAVVSCKAPSCTSLARGLSGPGCLPHFWLHSERDLPAPTSSPPLHRRPRPFIRGPGLRARLSRRDLS